MSNYSDLLGVLASCGFASGFGNLPLARVQLGGSWDLVTTCTWADDPTYCWAKTYLGAVRETVSRLRY